MKRILILTGCLILFVLPSCAVSSGYRTVSRQRTDKVKGYEEAVAALNNAQVKQIIEEFDLSKSERKRFDAIYSEYRRALERGLKELPTDAELRLADKNGQLRFLKDKLSNFATVAEIKRAYVDRFSEVLNADQIRALYNAESATSQKIKEKVAVNSFSSPKAKQLVGSGRLVSREVTGIRNDYTGLQTSYGVEVALGSGPETVVTADDNVIDYVRVEQQGGTVKIYLHAGSVSNCTVKVALPFSARLREVTACIASRITGTQTIGGVSDVRIAATAGSAVFLPVRTTGSCELQLTSSSRYRGEIEAGTCRLSLTSGAIAEAPIRSTGTCDVACTSSARLESSVSTSGKCRMQLTSGSRATGGIDAADLELNISSSARYEGDLQLKNKATVNSTSGAKINATLTAQALQFVGTSSSSAQFTGGRVDEATAEISSGSFLGAEHLVVRNLSVRATSGSRADVFCSGLLKVESGSGSKISYGGDCRVEYGAQSGIRKR